MLKRSNDAVDVFVEGGGSTAVAMHLSISRLYRFLGRVPLQLSSRSGQLFKEEIRGWNVAKEESSGGKWKGGERRQNEKFTDWHRTEGWRAAEGSEKGEMGQNSERDSGRKGEKEKERERRREKRNTYRHPLGRTRRMRAIPCPWRTMFPWLYGYPPVIPPSPCHFPSFSLISSSCSASSSLNFVSIPSLVLILFSLFFPSLSICLPRSLEMKSAHFSRLLWNSMKHQKEKGSKQKK